MADTSIPNLTSMGSSSVADGDLFVIADIDAGDDKKITALALPVMLNNRGMMTIEFGEPSDASIPAGSAIAWVDTSASPLTLNVKTRDTSSPEVVTNFVIG